MDYVIGGFAGVGAGFFSNPFDVIRTRMQLQGELKARGQHAIHYKNIIHGTYSIVKADGITALQKGLVPALWFQLIVNGTRLGIYQTADNNGLIRDTHGNSKVLNSIFFGALSGGSAAFFGSPFMLVKTQLMSYSHKSIAVGHQHGHNSSFRAFMKIYNAQGLKGLWRGCTTTMLRNSIGSPAQIVTFSRVKEIFKENDWLTNYPLTLVFLASLIGGYVKAIVMTPMDVIVTRLYNQGVDAQGRGLFYNGLADCAVKITRTEGLLAFYKGFGPSFLRQGPHSVLLLVFWDKLKDLQKNYDKCKKNDTV